MKKIFVVILFAFMQLPSFAQYELGYTYDAAGNRIKRELLLGKSQTRAKRGLNEFQDNYTDRLDKQLIKISPNPTHGIIRVHIDRYSNDEQYVISVYTVGGEQVFYSGMVEETTDVDLSGRPNGIYLLKIANANNSITWKIIKR